MSLATLESSSQVSEAPSELQASEEIIRDSKESAGALNAAFAAAYHYIFAIGRRWSRFGKKLRLESRRPESNWVEHKSGKSLDDLRKMF